MSNNESMPPQKGSTRAARNIRRGPDKERRVIIVIVLLLLAGIIIAAMVIFGSQNDQPEPQQQRPSGDENGEPAARINLNDRRSPAMFPGATIKRFNKETGEVEIVQPGTPR